MKKKKIKVKKKPIFILAGIFGIIILLVIVLGTDKLKIKLKVATLEYKTEYSDNFVATFEGEDVTKDVVVTNNIKNDKLGSYKVTFSYTKDGKTYQTVKKIQVVDQTKPEIILNGSKNIIILLGDIYSESGCKAIDNYDGDISNKVSITGEVDAAKEGDYEIKYLVSDSNGNVNSVIRKVTVTKTSPIDMDINNFSLTGYFPDTLLAETEDMGEEYFNEFIIAGDSMALYYVMNKAIPGTRLWHREGITSEGALTTNIYINHIDSGMTFAEAFKKNKPKKVIMTLGSNSVATMEVEYFIKCYKELLQSLIKASPDTDIIVQAIPPVDAFYDENNKGLNNKAINKFNYYILQMCNELGLPFLNTAEALKDANGQLKDEYSREDGVHPSKEGQEVMVKYARTHAIGA